MTNNASPASTSSSLSPVPCSKCRKRRIKCDKSLPGCQQCAKLSKPCPGYNRLRSFVDQGAALREKYGDVASPQQHARMEEEQTSEGEATIEARNSTHPASSLPMMPHGPAVALPATGVNRDCTQPATFSSTQNDQDSSSSRNLDLLSDEEFDATFFDIDPVAYYADEMNCCGWIPNAQLINTGQENETPALSWLGQIGSHTISGSTASLASDTPELTDTMSSASSRHAQQEADRETARLIQHFSAHISPCLDVFDVERYFGRVVPIQAHRSTLLTNLVAAIASKQFSKTTFNSAQDLPQRAADSRPERQHGGTISGEWSYKAASFYDKAISQMVYMLQGLHNGNGELSSILQPDTPRFETNSDSKPSVNSPSRYKRRRTNAISGPARTIEDLLAAVSICLLYESFDQPHDGMLGHVSGANYLLSKSMPHVTPEGSLLQLSSSLENSSSVKAWRASFWNFARVDYVLSYAKQLSPRLNPDECELWASAGLPLRLVDGMLIPQSLCDAGQSEFLQPLEETVACRTLIWLVLKSLTIVCPRDDGRMGYNRSHRGQLGGSNSWQVLRDLLDDWRSALPDTFEPFASLENQDPSILGTPSYPQATSIDASGEVVVHFPTLMYTSFMASTAMALYHFIQIYLLLHKPLETPMGNLAKFASQRLEMYRSALGEINEHADRICGICLGQPQESAKMHMAQPLHLAGLCAETKQRRLTLEGLLSGIQHTTGFTTDWIVTELNCGESRT